MKKQMSTKYIDIPIKIGEPFSLECFHVNQDSKVTKPYKPFPFKPF